MAREESIKAAAQQLLGAILLDNSTMNEVATIVQAGDFLDTKYKVMFAAMLDAYRDRSAIDPATLANYLLDEDADGGLDHRLELKACCGTTRNATHHAEMVAEAARRRRLGAAGWDLAHEAEAGIDSVEDMAAHLNNTFRDVIADRRCSGFVCAAEAVLEAAKDFGEAYNNGGKIPGLPTGLPSLDNSILGLNKGDLIVLAARPGMGKTALALNMALAVLTRAEDVGVAFLSQEMGAKQLAQRAIASQGGPSVSAQREGRIGRDQMAHYTQIQGEIYNLFQHFHVYDLGGLTPTSLHAHISRICQPKNISLLVVDYLQLMVPDGSQKRAENRTQQISAMVRSLKRLAREFSIPVLALCQVNREVDKRPNPMPVLADLRESGEIEASADIVLCLHRDEEDATLMVAKHRNGRTGKIELRFIPREMRFYERARN